MKALPLATRLAARAKASWPMGPTGGADFKAQDIGHFYQDGRQPAPLTPRWRPWRQACAMQVALRSLEQAQACARDGKQDEALAMLDRAASARRTARALALRIQQDNEQAAARAAKRG